MESDNKGLSVDSKAVPCLVLLSSRGGGVCGAQYFVAYGGGGSLCLSTLGSGCSCGGVVMAAAAAAITSGALAASPWSTAGAGCPLGGAESRSGSSLRH